MYGTSLPEGVVVQERPALVDVALLCLNRSEIHGNRGVLARRGGGERSSVSMKLRVRQTQRERRPQLLLWLQRPMSPWVTNAVPV